MNARRVPATPVESATSFDMMRVLLFHACARRKTPLRVTLAQMQQAAPGMLRVVLTKDFAIEAWIETSQPDMRRGVPYVLEPPEADEVDDGWQEP